MRRQPLALQGLLALVIFWLAASVPIGGAAVDAGAAFGSVHHETVLVSAPHATLGSVTAPKKSSDWSSRLFLPSRVLAVRDAGAATAPAFAFTGFRDRASRTVTYDATAPPAATLNTVR